VTRLIESSVRIIAVDNSFDQGQSSGNTVAKSVTVAVSPEQVARLTQAQSSGRLSLSLVGVGEEAITERVEVDTNSMLGIVEEEIVPEVAARSKRSAPSSRLAPVAVYPHQENGFQPIDSCKKTAPSAS
jgi:pilus assembly protein CpaB